MLLFLQVFVYNLNGFGAVLTASQLSLCAPYCISQRISLYYAHHIAFTHTSHFALPLASFARSCVPVDGPLRLSINIMYICMYKKKNLNQSLGQLQFFFNFMGTLCFVLRHKIQHLINYSLFFKVSWIRHRDLHLLTVDDNTYTSDQRFTSIQNKQTGDWSLQVCILFIISTNAKRIASMNAMHRVDLCEKKID